LWTCKVIGESAKRGVVRAACGGVDRIARASIAAGFAAAWMRMRNVRVLRSGMAGAALVAILVGATPARADDLADIRKLHAAGELSAALQRVDQALAARPKDAQLRFARGVLLAEARREDEAMEAFTRLNEDYPELPDPLNNIAVLHAAGGRLDQARVALETALRNDPRHRAVRENLADVYLRLAIRLWDGLVQGGDVEQAVQRKLRLARELLRAPG
jgi:Flp pilus assembly protein TadD